MLAQDRLLPTDVDMTTRRSVLVVGGGIVGLATALRIQQKYPHANVKLLEKEQRVGAHQSTHNSGVLHCGLYYKPGSLKARLAVQGIRQMIAFCRAHDIAHEVCGKVVVATQPEELPRLEELMRRGIANGLEGLSWLDPAALHQIEPNATGLAAVRVPEEGIVDYRQVCETLALELKRKDGRVVLGAQVEKLFRHRGQWVAQTGSEEHSADMLVTCAGLQSDRVGRMAGANFDMRILPFRGEYYKLAPEASGMVRHLIYPVPDPKFPFLGVHFTRLIHGGIEAGPNAVLALAREGYRWGNINLRDLWDALAFGGLWRFMRRYFRMVASEVMRSFSKDSFCKSLQRLVPDIQPHHLTTGGSGVRAQAMTPAGELVQDFELSLGDRVVHVLNAPSPAATASLAIGSHIVNHVHL